MSITGFPIPLQTTVSGSLSCLLPLPVHCVLGRSACSSGPGAHQVNDVHPSRKNSLSIAHSEPGQIIFQPSVMGHGPRLPTCPQKTFPKVPLFLPITLPTFIIPALPPPPPKKEGEKEGQGNGISMHHHEPITTNEPRPLPGRPWNMHQNPKFRSSHPPSTVSPLPLHIQPRTHLRVPRVLRDGGTGLEKKKKTNKRGNHPVCKKSELIRMNGPIRWTGLD